MKITVVSVCEGLSKSGSLMLFNDGDETVKFCVVLAHGHEHDKHSSVFEQ